MRSVSRFLPVVALAALAACADNTPLDPQPDIALGVSGHGARRITVMSRNMYIGADVDPVLEAIVSGNPQAALAALQVALGQVQRTDFPTRVAAIADEIARVRPHVVGLQEVYNLDVIPAYLGLPGDPIHQDFLDALMAELATRGLGYVVAATNTLTDVTLAGGAVHLVDHDAMLIDPARVTLAGPGQGAVFQVNLGDFLPPGSPNVIRGYVYAQALVEGVPTLLVNSHLEAGPSYGELRYYQALELAYLAGMAPNVILMGDLNDVAGSPMYQVVAGAGLTDLWSAMRPGASGFTCCQLADLSNHGSVLDERIDYVWAKGFAGPSGRVQGQVNIISDRPSALLAGALGSVWPSDHAGLSATLLLPASLLH